MGEQFKVGDKVIVLTHGRDYGKMCTVISISDNLELPVRIKVINEHDPFDAGLFSEGVTEKWIRRDELRLSKET